MTSPSSPAKVALVSKYTGNEDCGNNSFKKPACNKGSPPVNDIELQSKFLFINQRGLRLSRYEL